MSSPKVMGPFHRRRSVVVMATVAATGGFLYGFDTAIISGALPLIIADWKLSALMQGALTSAILVGGMIGSLVGGSAADRLGRRTVMMGMAATFVVGAFMCGLAPSLWPLMFGRALLGLAVGIVSVAVPLYIAEIAPANIRGALLSMQQLFLVGGVLASYVVNTLLVSYPNGWRLMFMTGALPGLVLGVGMLFMPESPRWLVERGREGSARRMLRRLGVPDPDAELADLQRAQGEQHAEKASVASWSELREGWVRQPLIIGVLLIFFQQMSGIGFVTYYSPTIFGLAGFSAASTALILTAGMGALNFVMTALSMALVDRLGRRRLFGGGLLGVVATLATLAVALDRGPQWKWIVAGAVFAYIAAFALSLGAVVGALIGEIYPQRIRGLALSVVIVASWIFQIAVSSTFPYLLAAVGPSLTFLSYALIGVFGILFCLFYMPETKGHTLEEIEQFWRSGEPARKLR